MVKGSRYRGGSLSNICLHPAKFLLHLPFDAENFDAVTFCVQIVGAVGGERAPWAADGCASHPQAPHQHLRMAAGGVHDGRRAGRLVWPARLGKGRARDHNRQRMIGILPT